MKFLSQTKKLPDSEIRMRELMKEQFPYQYKGSDLVVALAAGFTLGLWLGYMFGVAL